MNGDVLDPQGCDAPGGALHRLRDVVELQIEEDRGAELAHRLYRRAAVGDEMPLYSPKIALGESVGASSFWQLIAAAKALETGTLPTSSTLPIDSRALVLACGLNQQTGGLTLHLSRPRC